MVEARLESLIQRLENAVARQEALAGGQSPAGGATAAPVAKECKNAKDFIALITPKVQTLKQAAQSLGIAQVVKATDQIISLVNLNVAFFHTQQSFKKPADLTFLVKPATPVGEDILKVKQKDFKSPPNHMQTLVDGCSVVSWIFYIGEDQVKEWAWATTDQIKFYGNKVLALEKPLDSAWYNAYFDLMDSVCDFLVKRAENICDWTGKGDGAQAFFDGIAQQVMGGDFNVAGPGGSASAPAQAAAKPQAAAATSGHSVNFRAAVSAQVSAMKTTAATLAIPQVIKATDLFTELVELQARIMEAQARFKKPADLSVVGKRFGEVYGELDTMQRKDMKAPPNHIKTILDGLQLFSWPMTPGDDMLKDHLKETYDQIQFYGNKVLQLNKDNDTNWFNAYRDLAKAFCDFLSSQAETICNWTGKEDASGLESFLTSGASTPAPTATPAAEEKKEPAKPAAAAKPAEKKPKQPKKSFANKIWTVENYGEEEVTFTEDEVEKNHRVSIFNCTGTTVRIPTKCNVIIVEGSKKINVYPTRIMNSVDVINSQMINIFGGIQMGMVNVESSKEIKVTLNNATRACKVQTCCSRSVFVRFPKSGASDQEVAENPKLLLSIPIGEQYETVITGDEIKTEVLEAME